MTGVSADNSRHDIVKLLKNFIIDKGFIDMPFGMAVSSVMKITEAPSYLVEEAFDELYVNKYDDILVDIVSNLINEYGLYHLSFNEVVSTLRSKLDINENVIRAAYNKVHKD